MSSGKVLGGGPCKHCGGTGHMEIDANGKVIDLTIGAEAKEKKCIYCLGMGWVQRGQTCTFCHGTGKVPVTPASK
jgi:RecJ-like exonuclease